MSLLRPSDPQAALADLAESYGCVVPTGGQWFLHGPGGGLLEDHEDPEDLDDSEEQDEGHEVQEHLLRFSGAPAREILRVTAASTMADEPSKPVVHVSDAHECNEGSTGPPCGNLNESGASMSDGASESSCTCCQCRQSI